MALLASRLRKPESGSSTERRGGENLGEPSKQRRTEVLKRMEAVGEGSVEARGKPRRTGSVGLYSRPLDERCV